MEYKSISCHKLITTVCPCPFLVYHSNVALFTKLGLLEHFHITVVFILSHDASSMPTANGDIHVVWQHEVGVDPS